MPRLTLVPSMLSAWSVVISDATSATHTPKSLRSVLTLPRNADLARPVLHRAQPPLPIPTVNRRTPRRNPHILPPLLNRFQLIPPRLLLIPRL
jgi:hypothetical protein